MNNNPIESRHHLIQRCRQEEYNISDPRNIKKMIHVQHVALHQLFHNLTTPKDQIAKMMDLSYNVLSDQAKELLYQLLNLPDHQFYCKGIVK